MKKVDHIHGFKYAPDGDVLESASSSSSSNMALPAVSEKPVSLKAVVVGGNASDQIGLLYRYKNGKYPEKLPVTMENEIVSLSIHDSKVSLKLLNIQGLYDQMRFLSYQDTNVFILTYSVMDLDSLNEIEKKWARELREHCPNAQIILVGCNSDSIVNAVSPIPSEYVQEVVANIGAAAQIECSAQTGENVEKVFLTAAQIGYEQKQKVDSTAPLVAELNDYISRRKQKGEQSPLSSFFGGIPMTTKTDMAQDVIDTVQGKPRSKSFSAYHKTPKEVLLKGDLGIIINKYPEVAAKIKGETSIVSGEVSASPYRKHSL